MNNRILELMRQADYPAPEIALRAQRLAELIVRECAEIADVEKPNSIGCGYITKTKGMLIKQHFGVAE
jgi:hypothetical protein